MKKTTLLVCLLAVISCQTQQEQLPVVQAALYDTSSVYYTDFSAYPSVRNSLPIGVFDSGTGGLTVLEAIIGSRLLDGENYIYLGDQANMPYGNYAAENKTDFLRELIMKDAFFLLGQQIKILVVACNTATAYGLEDIRDYLEKSSSGIKAIGVIHAGVNATLDRINSEEDMAVGVMATTGTIASGGYENTFRTLAAQRGYRGRLQITNRGSFGFAEAVDGEKDFVNPAVQAPRESYRGPSLHHPEFPINRDLLGAYNFDYSNGPPYCLDSRGCLLVLSGKKMVQRQYNIHLVGTVLYTKCTFLFCHLHERLRGRESPSHRSYFYTAHLKHFSDRCHECRIYTNSRYGRHVRILSNKTIYVFCKQPSAGFCICSIQGGQIYARETLYELIGMCIFSHVYSRILLSIIIVTGPSFIKSTSISAPKTPV
jgi:glutamate racemase